MSSEQGSNSTENFVRWQIITINHLTYTINIFLVLSIGIIGYLMNLLSSLCFFPTCESKAFLITSIGLFIFSIFLGLWATINRLNDFRMTAKIARGKEESIDEIRNFTRKLGNKTWCCFYLQLLLFGLGFIFSVITLFIVYKDKLL